MSTAMLSAIEIRISARAAGRLFPPGRHDKPRDPGTVARYVRDGLAVRGRVVRLEGGRNTDGGWWTTAEAVARFLAELTAAWGDATPTRARAAGDAVDEFKRLRQSRRATRKAR